MALKTEGPLEQRCRQLALRVWWAVAALVVLITAVSFLIQPQLTASFSARPWGYVFPVSAVIALALVRLWTPRRTAASFLASSAFIATMLVSAAFGLFPYVLPSSLGPQFGLTISNAAAAEYGLRIGLWWFIPGIALAIGYFLFTYRRFAGKVRPAQQGY